jgi:hypothetical protein
MVTIDWGKKEFQHNISTMHQIGPNCNTVKNFSSLALKGEAAGLAKSSAYGGGARDRRIFLLLQTCFLGVKQISWKKHYSVEKFIVK